MLNDKKSLIEQYAHFSLVVKIYICITKSDPSNLFTNTHEKVELIALCFKIGSQEEPRISPVSWEFMVLYDVFRCGGWKLLH